MITWVDPHVRPIPLLSRKKIAGDGPTSGGGHKAKSSSA